MKKNCITGYWLLLFLLTLSSIIQAKNTADNTNDWKNGEIVVQQAEEVYGPVYRKFIKKTSKGFLVQEFYLDNDQPSTNPFLLTHKSDVTRLPKLYYDYESENPIIIDGPYQRWYPTGKIAFQGQYINGKRAGTWSFWDRISGYKYLENNFINGKLDGFIKNWDKDGSLISKTFAQQGNIITARFYNNKDKHISYWSQYHINGTRMQSGEMKNDKREGMWIYWNDKGKKEAEGYFVEGKRNGNWKTFWPEKEQKARRTLITVKRSEGQYLLGKKTGLWLYWDEQGQQTEKTYN